MADRKLATLLLQGKQAVADEFVEHCRDAKPELISVLPKRREIANQVGKILGERRAQPLPNAANNRTDVQKRH